MSAVLSPWVGGPMKRRLAVLSLTFSVVLLLLLPTQAIAGTIVFAQASVDSAGVAGSADSDAPSASPDMRFIAFESLATNLVPGDTNGVGDVFLRDTGTTGIPASTIRVSVNSQGVAANGHNSDPSISADGRFVAFTSYASNLQASDQNGTGDVYVRDTLLGTTTLASADSNGSPGDSYSGWPAISADGRYIAFVSAATNLVAGDTNGMNDVFVRDRVTGITELVSRTSASQLVWANYSSRAPQISADGRYVAFASDATNLSANDLNGVKTDIFVRDRVAGTTTLVSANSSGIQADGSSGACAISADGKRIAFDSYATNLVSGDGNGRCDIFLRDTAAGTTVLVSGTSTGGWGDDHSGLAYPVSISADGRFVGFSSLATNILPNDTNGSFDVFIRDTQTNTVRCASVNSAGQFGDSASIYAELSADGLKTAIESHATNLLVPDRNGSVSDVFIQELVPDPPIIAWGSYGTTASKFVAPLGLELLGGRVYVADTANSRIQYFDADGNYLGQFGSLGTGSGQFNRPRGIAASSDGNLWIADTNNNRVEKYTPAGVRVSGIGGSGVFDHPSGIAESADGRYLYVSNAGSSSEIAVMDISGPVPLRAGSIQDVTSSTDHLNLPLDIALDASGNLWVADSENHRLVKFDSSGRYVLHATLTGTRAVSPWGVAVDPVTQSVWVTNYSNCWLEEFSQSGSRIQRLGGPGTALGQFAGAAGIGIDGSRRIYVVDSEGCRVQRFPAWMSKPGTVQGSGVVFHDIVGDGSLSVSQGTPANGGPDGFRLLPGAYFDISTTVAFDGTAELNLPYDPAQLGGADPSTLRLYHYTGTTWQDITTRVDTDANVVVGETDSFSPFAIFAPLAPPTPPPVVTTPASSTWSTSLFVIFAAAVGMLARRRRCQRSS